MTTRSFAPLSAILAAGFLIATLSTPAAAATDVPVTDFVAFGVSALNHDQAGAQNVAVGYQALIGNQTGADNVAVGYEALNDNTAGNGNVAVGQNALFLLQGSVATGSNNIAIGANSGNQLSTGSSNIYVGNVGSSSESDVIRIGTSGTQTTAFVAGIHGVSTGLAGAAVLVDANGQLGTVSSSRRYKEDIEPWLRRASGS